MFCMPGHSKCAIHFLLDWIHQPHFLLFFASKYVYICLIYTHMFYPILVIQTLSTIRTSKQKLYWQKLQNFIYKTQRIVLQERTPKHDLNYQTGHNQRNQAFYIRIKQIEIFQVQTVPRIYRQKCASGSLNLFDLCDHEIEDN